MNNNINNSNNGNQNNSNNTNDLEEVSLLSNHSEDMDFDYNLPSSSFSSTIHRYDHLTNWETKDDFQYLIDSIITRLYYEDELNYGGFNYEEDDDFRISIRNSRRPLVLTNHNRWTELLNRFRSEENIFPPFQIYIRTHPDYVLINDTMFGYNEMIGTAQEQYYSNIFHQLNIALCGLDDDFDHAHDETCLVFSQYKYSFVMQDPNYLNAVEYCLSTAAERYYRDNTFISNFSYFRDQAQNIDAPLRSEMFCQHKIFYHFYFGQIADLVEIATNSKFITIKPDEMFLNTIIASFFEQEVVKDYLIYNHSAFPNLEFLAFKLYIDNQCFFLPFLKGDASRLMKSHLPKHQPLVLKLKKPSFTIHHTSASGSLEDYSIQQLIDMLGESHIDEHIQNSIKEKAGFKPVGSIAFKNFVQRRVEESRRNQKQSQNFWRKGKQFATPEIQKFQAMDKKLKSLARSADKYNYKKSQLDKSKLKDAETRINYSIKQGLKHRSQSIQKDRDIKYFTEPCGEEDSPPYLDLIEFIESLEEMPEIKHYADSKYVWNAVLSIYSLYRDPTIANAVIWILKTLIDCGIKPTMFISKIKSLLSPMYDGVNHVIDLLKCASGKLPWAQERNMGGHGNGSAATHTDETLEDNIIHETHACGVEEISHLSALFACAAAVIGSAMMGNQIYDESRAQSWVGKAVTTSASLSKLKNGIYGVIQLCRDVYVWVKDFVRHQLEGQPLIDLHNIFKELPVNDESKELAQDYFAHVEYFTNPDNFNEIERKPDSRSKLKNLISITHHLFSLEANGKVKLSSVQSKILDRAYNDLRKVHLKVLKNLDLGSFRKTPFWLYIYGDAGVGKSQIVPLVSNTFIKCLRRLQETKYEGKNVFNLPSEHLMHYSVNFTDKFLTGYKGQYILTVDDAFQDASVLGERSSALDLISWVSCIPYRTNQASTDDKGIPFESMVVISSSNMGQPMRKEICENKALYRRRNLCVEMTSKNPYQFRLVNSINGEVVKTLNFTELMRLFVQEYESHYLAQVQLENSKQVDEKEIDEIMNYTEASGIVEHIVPSVLANAFESQVGIGGVINNTFLGNIWRLSTTPIRMIFHFIFVIFCGNWLNIPYLYTNWIANLIRGEIPVEFFLIDCFTKNKVPRESEQRWYSEKNFWKGICSAFLRFNSSIRESLEKLLKSYIYKTLIIIGIVCSAAILWWKMKPANESQASGIPYNNSVQRATSSILVPSGVPYNNSVPRAQSTLLSPAGNVAQDENAMILINNLVDRNNIVTIIRQSYKNPSALYKAHGIRVSGTWILANWHALGCMQEGDKFQVKFNTSNNGEYISNQIMRKNFIYRISDKDACLYQLDNSTPRCRDILHHFTEGLHDRLYKGVIPIVHPYTTSYANLDIQTVTTESITYQDADYADAPETYLKAVWYRATGVNVKGNSGAPLIVTDNRVAAKILGICTSVSAKHNFTSVEPIFRQELEAIINEFTLDYSPELNVDSVMQAAGVCVYRPLYDVGKKSLIYLGDVSNDKAISFSLKTKLRRSEITDLYENKKEPSVLHRSDLRIESDLPEYDLAYHTMKNFDTEYGSLDRLECHNTTSEMWQEYDRFEASTGRRELTWDEVVNGIPGVFNSLDCYTSPGYPWILKKGKKIGKYDWFEYNEDKSKKMNHELQEKVLHDEKLMLEGRRPDYVFYYCLKDELRKPEKIKAGKTRGFMCLPMELNLIVRKYFGAFTIGCHQHLLLGATPKVGIDSFTEWTEFYHELNKHGDKYWKTFDYTGWDASLHPQLFWEYCKIVNKWYGDEPGSDRAKLRFTVASLLTQSFVLNKRKLFLKMGGMPSGCAVTADANSVIHDWLVYYVWRKFWTERGKFDLISLNAYRANTVTGTYGDDFIQSSTEKVKDFNGNNIKGYFDDLGMAITSAKKDLNFDFEPPNQITFLKRSFIKNEAYPKVIMCPLDKTSIEDIPLWIHKCDDPASATYENMLTALREGVQWGHEYYQKLRELLARGGKHITSRLHLRYYPYILPSYEDQLNECLLTDGKFQIYGAKA